MRCSGSSFACAALGCERAGDVNQVWMGAVMGRSLLWKWWDAAVAEAVAVAVASAGVRRELCGVVLGMGGYTTTTDSSVRCRVGTVVHGKHVNSVSA
jgi:type II secretory pathway component PulM